MNCSNYSKYSVTVYIVRFQLIRLFTGSRNKSANRLTTPKMGNQDHEKYKAAQKHVSEDRAITVWINDHELSNVFEWNYNDCSTKWTGAWEICFQTLTQSDQTFLSYQFLAVVLDDRPFTVCVVDLWSAYNPFPPHTLNNKFATPTTACTQSDYLMSFITTESKTNWQTM